MTYYLKNGNRYDVTDERNIDLHNYLPVGNYIVKQDPRTGAPFLEAVDSFTPLKKVYGNASRNADRIFNTFVDRTVSTGVLLTGEKGSGKTLLAKNLSLRCAEDNIPTIIINMAWTGDVFNKFMQDIEQPCMVLFDEFEKVYDREEQEHILTLLDGVFPSKKLFVLTCNDKYRIDYHMRNRPGRIFYSLDFKGLEPEFIREYCADNLNEKNHINTIVQIASLFGEFNFDMLKALVEEMNRYNEDPVAAMRMLNAKPEFEDNAKHEMTVIYNNNVIPPKCYWPNEWNGNPLKDELNLSLNTAIVKPKRKKSKNTPVPVAVTSSDPLGFDEEEDDGNVNLQFNASFLESVSSTDNSYTFRHPKGVVLVLKRKRSHQFQYTDLF